MVYYPPPRFFELFLIAINDLKRSNYKQQVLLIITTLKVALSYALPLAPQLVPPDRALHARQLLEGSPGQ